MEQISWELPVPVPYDFKKIKKNIRSFPLAWLHAKYFDNPKTIYFDILWHFSQLRQNSWLER